MKIALRIGLLLSIIGLVLLTLFGVGGSEIDDDGILREPFFLLGIGAPTLFLGMVLLLGALAAKFVAWIASSRQF